MPNLIESLQGRDPGHLQIIARLWGIEPEEQPEGQALASLAPLWQNILKVNQVIANLPVEAGMAMDDLIKHSGRLPWAQFTRTYGELREMGPAKRDRERPYEHPVSAVEILWYRALISKSFFDTPGGPEEFAYIPDDL